MNKHDRASLQKALELLSEAKGIIESLAEDERAKFDNMPEGLQNGERGQAIEQAADALEEAQGTIEDSINTLENIE